MVRLNPFFARAFPNTPPTGSVASVIGAIVNAARPEPPPARDDRPRHTDATCEPDRLPDPAPATLNEQAAKRSYAHVPLFKNGIETTDVYQGQLANCYVAGGFSALAQTDPKAIRRMFRPNLDGTWSVRFYRFDVAGAPKAEWIKVDADLYGDDNPIYGQVKGELWYALAEKAFAEFNGSYGTIGKGGNPADVMAAVTGKRSDTKWVGDDETRWNTITRQIDANKPVAFCTPKKDEDGRFARSEFANWHCYAVVGYETDGMGERWVYVRNPWGSTTSNNSEWTKGISRVPLDTLSYYFGNTLYTVS